LITLAKTSRSCAAHRDPQLAGLGRRVDGGLDPVGLQHVGLDEAGPLAELVRQRFATLRVQVGHHHPRSVGVQTPRRGLPEPGGTADDERALARDPHPG
jgi:hypothetical protein